MREISRRKPGPDGLEHLSTGWEHAQKCERSSIDEGITIDQNLELPITAAHDVHVDLELTTKPRRHPDGMDAGDSVRAVVNCNPSHL